MEIGEIVKLVQEYNDNKKELANLELIKLEDVSGLTFIGKGSRSPRQIWFKNGFEGHAQEALNNYKRELTTRSHEIKKTLEEN